MKKLLLNMGLVLGSLLAFSGNGNSQQVIGNWNKLQFLKSGNNVDPGLPGNWLELDIGLVNATARIGNDLYIGGLFDDINRQTDFKHFVKLTEDLTPGHVRLESLGTFNGEVKCIQELNGEIWVAGAFTKIGNSTVNRIACYNPTTGKWRGITDDNGTIGLERGSGAIYALKVTQDHIYIGGQNWGGYDEYGQCFRVFNRNTNTWSVPGKGIHGVYAQQDYTVRAIEVDNQNNVYVGGFFPEINTETDDKGKIVVNGVVVNHIAYWDGTNWNALSDSDVVGISEQFGTSDFGFPWVRTLNFSNGKMYIGGSFKNAGNQLSRNIATWDGSKWGGIGNGLNGQVNVIRNTGNYVYIGGMFTQDNDWNDLGRITRWDGQNFEAFGKGMKGSVAMVSNLTIDGSNVWVGGAFQNGLSISGKGIGARGIALWTPEDNDNNGVKTNVDSELAQIQVFPNPSTGIIQISSEQNSIKNLEIKVFAIDGSLVFHQNMPMLTQLKRHSIDLQSLPGGVYQIQVSGEGFIANQKISLNK